MRSFTPRCRRGCSQRDSNWSYNVYELVQARLALRSRAVGAGRIVMPMRKLATEDAGGTKPIRCLHSIAGLCASVYEKHKTKQLLDNAKTILKAVMGFAKIKTAELQLIDDADWTLFSEIGA